jgi:integrase
VQCRPFEHVKPFTETGLAVEQQQADRYLWVKGKGGRVRWVPLATPVQHAALELAQQVVASRDAHMGAPDRDLKRNLRRFDYVLEKFGITLRERGATGHGLRHERLNDAYEGITGCPRRCAAVVRCRRSWTGRLGSRCLSSPVMRAFAHLGPT